MSFNIRIKLLDKNCEPVKKHRWDAGWDLKTTLPISIDSGKTIKVHTGVCFEIPARHFGMVVARSGLGCKHGITLANDVGIIDSEYRGEIIAYLTNNSDKTYKLEQWDRFAQIIITPVNSSALRIVDHLSDTGRGDGGWGSTDTKRFDSTKENKSNVPKELPMSIAQASKEAYEETMADFVQIKDQITDVKSTTTTTAKEDDEIIIDINKDVNDILNDKKLIDIVNNTKALLPNLKPSEYIKLKQNGTLKEIYPHATGNMKTDLNL